LVSDEKFTPGVHLRKSDQDAHLGAMCTNSGRSIVSPDVTMSEKTAYMDTARDRILYAN
jgi:hypothetical protein